MIDKRMKNGRVSTDQFEASEQDQLNDLLLDVISPIPLDTGRQDALKRELLARTAQSVAKHVGLLTVRSKDGIWQTLMPGIRVKPLWNGPEGRSVLIEFAAGASLLPHRHNWLEEGIVLRGGLQMGDLELGPLDYHVSPAGSRHAVIRSRQGGLAYLRGTSLGSNADVLKEVLGGMLPFGRDESKTFFAAEDGWQEVAPKVWQKLLWTDGARVSSFYRLQPGASLPGHVHRLEEECMMLEGEVFLGDVLLRAGDYQLANAGSAHGELFTDVGATLFVRREQY